MKKRRSYLLAIFVILLAFVGYLIVPKWYWNYSYEGEFSDIVGKSPMSVAIVLKDTGSESSHKALRLLAAFSEKKKDVHYSVMLKESYEYKRVLEEVGADELIAPTTIVFNKKGDIAGVYEGSVPVDTLEALYGVMTKD